MASRPVTAPVSPRPKTSSKGARSPRKKAQPKTPFELDQEAKQARLQKLRGAAKNARPATQQQAREFIARIQAVTAKVDDKSDWRPSEPAQRGLSKLKGAGLMLRMGGGGGLMGLLGAIGGGRGDGAGSGFPGAGGAGAGWGGVMPGGVHMGGGATLFC